MYKITQQKDFSGNLIKRYTVQCYFHDENSNSNIEIWSMLNIDDKALADLLQHYNPEQSDVDFGLNVLESGNGPVILTEKGELLTAPVRKMVTIVESNNAKTTLFQRARDRFSQREKSRN